MEEAVLNYFPTRRVNHNSYMSVWLHRQAQHSRMNVYRRDVALRCDIKIIPVFSCQVYQRLINHVVPATGQVDKRGPTKAFAVGVDKVPHWFPQPTSSQRNCAHMEAEDWDKPFEWKDRWNPKVALVVHREPAPSLKKRWDRQLSGKKRTASSHGVEHCCRMCECVREICILHSETSSFSLFSVASMKVEVCL